MPHTSVRYGDCIQAGWTNVMDLITCFYRLQILPDTFSKALNGDGDVSMKKGQTGDMKRQKRGMRTNHVWGH